MKTPEIILSFIFYSILGWALDTLARSLQVGMFTSENGLGIPFSPMYGMAGLLVIALHPYIQKWRIGTQFLLYAVASAAYEYAGGVFSEWFLGRRLWDYSAYPLNVNAYTDPLHAVVWGVLCLLVVYWIQPHVHSAMTTTKKRLTSLVSEKRA